MSDPPFRVNETEEQFVRRCSATAGNGSGLFDCSEAEMLWLWMGPQRLPLALAVPISLLLALEFATGVVGNVAVCAVIATTRAMHTPTNYYLCSLALSDLLLLLFGLPNDMAVYWHQYPYSLGIVCCKLRALISEAASYVSVLTIVAFSLERYLAICHPLHPYAMAGLRRALRIVVVLWLVSFLAAAPFALYTTVNYHEYPPGSGNLSLESAFCGMLELPSWYLWELSSLIFFILPAFIILALYVQMGLRIRYVMGSSSLQKRGSPGTLHGVHGSVHGEARQSRRSIIKMLAAVVVAFFVCWAPFHFQRLFFIYGVSSPHYHAINEFLFNVAGLSYYMSATVNPILYNAMSHRYRMAFRETLCCGKYRRKKSKRFYRDQSSIRETTVNHTSEGTHLVRVRSSHDRRNRVDRRVFRSRSFYETTFSNDNWQHRNHANEIMPKNTAKSEQISNTALNNNDNQHVYNNDSDYADKSKLNAEEVDKNIKINISIHLHK